MSNNPPGCHLGPFRHLRCHFPWKWRLICCVASTSIVEGRLIFCVASTSIIERKTLPSPSVPPPLKGRLIYCDALRCHLKGETFVEKFFKFFVDILGLFVQYILSYFGKWAKTPIFLCSYHKFWREANAKLWKGSILTNGKKRCIMDSARRQETDRLKTKKVAHLFHLAGLRKKAETRKQKENRRLRLCVNRVKGTRQ